MAGVGGGMNRKDQSPKDQGAAAAGRRKLRDACWDIARGATAAGVLGLFINLLHLSLPLFMIQVYDRVISSRSLETLAALVVLVSVLLLFQTALDYLRGQIFSVLGERFAAKLGGPVFEASIETSLRRGGVAAGSMRDLGDVRAFVAGGAAALPFDIAVAPVFLAALYLLHPLFGLIGLIGAGLLAGAAIGIEVLARRPGALAADAAQTMHHETAAAIRAAEAVAAMGMLPAITRRWRRAQSATLAAQADANVAAKALTGGARMLRQALQIAVIATGATLVITDEASPGTLIAASVILGRLLLPFEQMIVGWRQWRDALASLSRLRQVLDSGAAARLTVPVAIADGRLVADRVTYTPQGHAAPILRNVSFRLESGELLGVVGPSGAGKSTLARLSVGLWAPNAGALYLDGQNVFMHERASFGAAVGYLPQDPMLLDGSVRENLGRMADADIGEVVRAARLAGIHDMIGALPRGYETHISDGGARFSGGQRQRLALARALFGAPKLLVLDEPNSSLDAEGEAALVAAIEISRQQGATVLVVAQRMSILHRADKLLVLKDGAIAHYGDRADVLAAIGPRGAAEPGRNVSPLPLRARSAT